MYLLNIYYISNIVLSNVQTSVKDEEKFLTHRAFILVMCMYLANKI